MRFKVVLLEEIRVPHDRQKIDPATGKDIGFVILLHEGMRVLSDLPTARKAIDDIPLDWIMISRAWSGLATGSNSRTEELWRSSVDDIKGDSDNFFSLPLLLK